MRPWMLPLVLSACASSAASLTTEPASPAAAVAAETAPVPVPPPPPSPPPPVQIGRREHGMRNCPTALAGITLQAVNTAMGVDLTITTRDPVIRRDLLERARINSHMGNPDETAAEHTGRHGGPGKQGYCPVIHADTNVTFTVIPSGAVIHVSALAPEDVPAVQAAVAERMPRLAER
jgi:hypothetical protein